MHFTVESKENEEVIWDMILKNLEPKLLKDVSPSTSGFFTTEDGLECSVRKIDGQLIASCYSESDHVSTGVLGFGPARPGALPGREPHQ